MGTYLSTPVTEKGEESGETPQLAWGVVDMQGWRKNMEDAHVAQTDVVVPSHLFASDEENTGEGKVFGVFDGHGGPEVARFCQLYIVSVLTQQPTWREAILVTESNMVYSWRDPATTAVGQALIQAFHAMDRLINDPLRREEIIRLRAEKPMPGEYRVACYVPPPRSVENYEESSDGDESSDQMNNEPDVKEPTVTPVPSETEDTSPQKVAASVEKESTIETTTTLASTQPIAEALVTNGTSDGATLDADTKNETKEPKTESSLAVEASESAEPGLITADVSPPSEQGDLESGLSSDVQPPPDSTEESATDVPQALDTQVDAKDAGVGVEGDHQKNLTEGDENDDGGKVDFDGEKEDDDGGKEDDDSNEAVGKEEAAELDQDMMDGDSSPPNASETTSLSSREESSNRRSQPGKVSVMFQKLLSISGQVVVNVVRDKGSESDTETDSSSQTHDTPVPFQSNQNTFGVSRPSAATPTIIHNGRQICNLPDHPIHAGCTAVVAVLIGRTLTIANAGDSRAVLCRAGGKAEPLSFDHKPLQEREMQRITRAGGFVNQFGRVNGNLNLSRSIGDLKYKQVPGISPAGQMITAEPDIIQVKLYPMDEFFILGCDGIWDCLTNDQAVAYVRERIDTKTPIEIGVEMLDRIISEDPRASQGIGGDNMTVMIVDLLPHTRSYRAKAS